MIPTLSKRDKRRFEKAKATFIAGRAVDYIPYKGASPVFDFIKTGPFLFNGRIPVVELIRKKGVIPLSYIKERKE